MTCRRKILITKKHFVNDIATIKKHFVVDIVIIKKHFVVDIVIFCCQEITKKIILIVEQRDNLLYYT